ncbi:MAG: DUF4838 domain-containing protein [Thermoflavifilum sp.]|nr:DUF4838 domain-containing protein [Thermoflavifilum sp.]
MFTWFKNFSLIFTVMYLLASLKACGQPATRLPIVYQAKSDYILIVPPNADRYTLQAAHLIQRYTQWVTGFTLPLITTADTTGLWDKPVIAVGKTAWVPAKLQQEISALPEGSIYITTIGKNVLLMGGGKRGVLNAAYAWIERVLQCHLYADSVWQVPHQKNLFIDPLFHILEQPVFSFRQVYDPQAMNARYMDWHRLNDFADFWGIWGHSFFKLIPPSQYFQRHPEYFALINGQRRPTQLCMSQPAVVAQVVKELRARIQKNPDALYWSVAPEDNTAFCQCDSCRALYARYGGISGALLHFVNEIAAQIPDHIITTLAYGPTQHPPQHLEAAPNVGIMLSTIDCDRATPIASDPHSAQFRQDLEGWEHLTHHLMIWDYTVQFTHYLAPFPDLHTFQPNIQYFAAHHVEAVFAQGSGEDQSVFDEMRCYLLAKLLWNPQANTHQLQKDFLQGYYGAAAPFIAAALDQLQQALLQSHARLDIYGNPLDAKTSWLSPNDLQAYRRHLDNALQAVKDKPQLQRRVQKLYLSYLYVRLLQAWFYGTDPHGAFLQDASGKWIINPEIPKLINQFSHICQQQHILYLNEDHQTVSTFIEQLQDMLAQGVQVSLAFHKPVRLLTPNIADYPAKGPQTLTDGIIGSYDYAFNWLGWNNQDMKLEIDLQQIDTIHQVTMAFLQDQRHAIFLPTKIAIYGGNDRQQLHLLQESTLPSATPDETVHRKIITLTIHPTAIRYLQIIASPLATMPDWANQPGRKPSIFISEVMVK